MNIKKKNNITYEFSGIEDLEKKTFVRNGEFHGVYDFSLKRAITGKFLNDKKEGTWLKWYENGKVQFEHNYFGGQLHGKFKHLWDNGTVALKGEYIFGKEHGKFEYFDRKGKKIKEADYDYGKILNYKNEEENYWFDLTGKKDKKSNKELKPALICSVWGINGLIDCRTRSEYFDILSDTLSPEDLAKSIDFLNLKYDELRNQLGFNEKDGILGLCPGTSFSATSSDKGRGVLGIGGRNYNKAMGNVQLTENEIIALTNKCSANSIDSVSNDNKNQNGVGGGGYFNDGNFQSGMETIETIRDRRENGLPLGEFGDFVEESIDRIESGLDNCVDSGGSPIALSLPAFAAFPHPLTIALAIGIPLYLKYKDDYIGLKSWESNGFIDWKSERYVDGTMKYENGDFEHIDWIKDDKGKYLGVYTRKIDGNFYVKVFSETYQDVTKDNAELAVKARENAPKIDNEINSNSYPIDDYSNSCAGKRFGWEITKKLCEGKWETPFCLNTLDEFHQCSDPTLVRFEGGGVKCKSKKSKSLKEAMEDECKRRGMIAIVEEGMNCKGPNQVSPNPFNDPCGPLTNPDPETGCFGVDMTGFGPAFPTGGSPSPIQMYQANSLNQNNNIRLVAEEDEFLQIKHSNQPKLVIFHSNECPPCHTLLNNLSNLKEKEEKYNGLEIVKIDIRQNPKLAREHNIEFTPTMMVFENGNEIGRRKVGAASIERLENYIDRTTKIGKEREEKV